jgi:hypothetical protein
MNCCHVFWVWTKPVRFLYAHCFEEMADEHCDEHCDAFLLCGCLLRQFQWQHFWWLSVAQRRGCCPSWL